MKLSMWILFDWLEKFHPIPDIVEGRMVLEKFYILSGGSFADKSALIIQRDDGSLKSGSSEVILLTNQNDTIRLRGCQWEEIHNKICDAFVYYNNWDMKLQQDARESEPEQKIIDDCAELFGPMFLINMEMRKIAMSKQYGLGTVNLVWDDLILKGVSSFEVFEKLRNSWFFDNYTKAQRCSVTKIENVAEVTPYNNCIIISQLDEYGDVTGQLLINSKRNFTVSERQLATVIYNALSSIRHQRPVVTNYEIISNFFYSMTSNSEDNENYRNFIYLVKNWSEQEEYCVTVFKKSDKLSLVNAKTTVSMMSTLLDHCVITYDKGSVITCINITKNHQYLVQVEQVCIKHGFCYGMSLNFEGLNEVYNMARQGYHALERKKQKFLEVAFESIMSCIQDRNFLVASIHPAIRKLKKFDQQNHMQLSFTLRIFLQCERSWVETAKKMFIHRNTVISRLNKISELVDLDLESAEQREYLLFSFKIFDLIE